jgi:hypothetical protein
MANGSPADRNGSADPADQKAHAGSEDASKTGSKRSRLASTGKALSTNPLVVTLIGVAATAALALYFLSPDQGAANKATVENQQQQQESTKLQYANKVTYGLATTQRDQNPRLMIFNQSSGWVRNITIIIPISYQDHAGRISLPGFKVVSGMVGWESEGINPSGADYTFQLPSLPPCEVGITAILSAVPNMSPAEFAASQLFFTDQRNVGWVRNGQGKLAQGLVPSYAQG